jgi:hypothetical protein
MRAFGKENMEIVAYSKSGKMTLQVVKRTEDIVLGRTQTIPGYSDDVLWEGENRKFRYRPTVNTREEQIRYGDTYVLVILEAVEKEAVEILLSRDEIRKKLELRGFYTE